MAVAVPKKNKGFSLIFHTPKNPGTRFDFLPAPAQVNHSRRSLNRIVMLPHGGVYRGLNGEDIGNIEVSGNFGMRARSYNGKQMLGNEIWDMLDNLITEYWEATGSKDPKVQRASRVEYHDWDFDKHLHVEIQSFDANRGPENKIHRTYDMRLESYGRIQRKLATAITDQRTLANRARAAFKLAIDSISKAGKTIGNISDRIIRGLNEEVIRPLEQLTDALSDFVTGASKFINAPFRMLNKLTNFISQTIEGFGTLVSAPITDLAMTMRQTRRNLNRLTRSPELFKKTVNDALEEFYEAHYLRADNSTTDLERDEIERGMNLERQRSAFRSASNTYTGAKKVDVRQGDTLQNIALRELDDSELWVDIALLNDMNGNSDLVGKSNILVPVQSGEPDSNVTSQLAGSSTLSNEERLYGRDTKLVQTENNKLSVVFGANDDLETIGGTANLLQAVTLKTKIKQGTLLEDKDFGLRTIIGASQSRQDADAIAWSIRETCQTDPRIESVEALVNVKGSLTEFSLTVFPAGLSGNNPISAVVQSA